MSSKLEILITFKLFKGEDRNVVWRRLELEPYLPSLIFGCVRGQKNCSLWSWCFTNFKIIVCFVTLSLFLFCQCSIQYWLYNLTHGNDRLHIVLPLKQLAVFQCDLLYTYIFMAPTDNTKDKIFIYVSTDLWMNGEPGALCCHPAVMVGSVSLLIWVSKKNMKV